MTNYQFAENIYLAPTPTGAFYAVSNPAPEPLRIFLHALLKQERTPKPITSQLINWTQANSVKSMMALLHEAQLMTYIEGLQEPLKLPDSGFGNSAEILLSYLSTSGNAVLVDNTGCAIAHSGFDQETVEMLSALSADLLTVQDRHEKRLEKHFDLTINGWGAMDASGSSRIGTWPIYIGQKRLLLVIPGEPRFNCPQFTLLIWSLVKRYFDQ